VKRGTVVQPGLAGIAGSALDGRQTVLFEDQEYSLRLEQDGPVLYVRGGELGQGGWTRNTSIYWPYLWHRIRGTNSD
jgi:GT2 family glycosyltransferase